MNRIIAPIVGAVVGIVALGWVSYDFRGEAMKASVQIGDFCSGTIIPDPDKTDGIQTTVLTAKHCVVDIPVGADIPVIYRTEDDGYVVDTIEVSFRVKSLSSKSDLALLQSNGVFPDDLVYDVVSDYDVDQGVEVYAIGYPIGLSQVITSGYAGAIEDLSSAGAGILRRASVGITGGNSGGGLFYIDLLGRYKLVGVCSMGFGTDGSRTTHITAWVPWTDIVDFLEGEAIAKKAS